jgi:hypothetical protein
LKHYYRAFRDTPDATFGSICEQLKAMVRTRGFPFISAFHSARAELLHARPAKTEEDEYKPGPRDSVQQADWDEERFRCVPQCIEKCSAKARYVAVVAERRDMTQAERDRLWESVGGMNVPRTTTTWSPPTTTRRVQ